MSMGLDSPIDALAINYLSQLHSVGVTYVWAWIAFATAAALSFWKIKLSSSSVVVHSPLHLNSPCLSSPSQTPTTSSSSATSTDNDDHHQQDEDEDKKRPSTFSLTSKRSSSSSSNSISRQTAFCSMENRRSGKFSMHYFNDDDDNTTNKLDETHTIGCSITHSPHPYEEEEEEKQDLLANTSVNYFQQQQQQQRQRELTTCGWEWEPQLLKVKTAEMVWYRYQDLTVLDGNVVRLWN